MSLQQECCQAAVSHVADVVCRARINAIKDKDFDDDDTAAASINRKKLSDVKVRSLCQMQRLAMSPRLCPLRHPFPVDGCTKSHFCASAPVSGGSEGGGIARPQGRRPAAKAGAAAGSSPTLSASAGPFTRRGARLDGWPGVSSAKGMPSTVAGQFTTCSCGCYRGHRGRDATISTGISQIRAIERFDLHGVGLKLMMSTYPSGR